MYICTDACIQHQLIYMTLNMIDCRFLIYDKTLTWTKQLQLQHISNFFYIFLYQQVSKIETTILGHNAESILILSEYMQLFTLRNFQLRRIYLMGTIPMQQELGAFEITMKKIHCCPLYLEVKYMLCPLHPLSKYSSVPYTHE